MTDPRFALPDAESLLQHAERWVDMVPHLDHLRDLAAAASIIVEFGVRAGVSTWALLDGLPPAGRMTSVDVVRRPLPRRITEDPRWSFVQGNDLRVPLPLADLVVIDTTHTYQQTRDELTRAVDIGARVIALHDWTLEPVRRAVTRWMPRDWTLRVHESPWGLAVVSREGVP